ncbi:Diphthine--ammonia ligase [Anabarilius grahami]|uniref:Diphthine--ammonia ligase n=1 Tax=Anabarilius grahami TaxID=495550 RepID=A0A3N0XHK3_ANAGA|nr:Diphthine--ammonia ligase [Anabarilius grahami]
MSLSIVYIQTEGVAFGRLRGTSSSEIRIMRVVALISGGKDSCYNMMQCVSAGHSVVALANLRPAAHAVSDELDSYMYQTVGHQAVDLFAEAMDLPLYRRTIKGSSLQTGREYSQTEGDEVEDLYQLLKLVKVNHWLFFSIFCMIKGALERVFKRCNISLRCPLNVSVKFQLKIPHRFF